MKGQEALKRYRLLIRIAKQLGRKENALVNGPERVKPVDLCESRKNEIIRS
jgi:hypothetical protein